MYENIPQKLPLELKPKPKSVIIFSAPSAYDSFVANFGWEDLYIAIAIGQSTFARFDKHITAYVSPSANFESCIAFAKDIARERNFQHTYILFSFKCYNRAHFKFWSKK